MQWRRRLVRQVQLLPRVVVRQQAALVVSARVRRLVRIALALAERPAELTARLLAERLVRVLRPVGLAEQPVQVARLAELTAARLQAVPALAERPVRVQRPVGLAERLVQVARPAELTAARRLQAARAEQPVRVQRPVELAERSPVAVLEPALARLAELMVQQAAMGVEQILPWRLL